MILYHLFTFLLLQRRGGVYLFYFFFCIHSTNKFLRILRHCTNVDGRIFLLLPISQLLVPRQTLYRYRRSAVDNRE